MRPDDGSARVEPARRFGARAVVVAALLGLLVGLVMGIAVARDVDSPGDRTQTSAPSSAASSVAVGLPTVVSSTNSPSPDARPVMARAELRAEPVDSVGSGVARLVGDPARPILEVTSALPGTTGFYQVWLADRDFEQLYALGILDRAGAGLFLVPPEIDLAKHTVVDVSAEPLDGDPTYSGSGMLRGELG